MVASVQAVSMSLGLSSPNGDAMGGADRTGLRVAGVRRERRDDGDDLGPEIDGLGGEQDDRRDDAPGGGATGAAP
jgi:hypothetical protein